jgi:integrase-like protein
MVVKQPQFTWVEGAEILVMRSNQLRMLSQEAFTGSSETNVCTTTFFVSLNNGRRIIKSWRVDYNVVRPHSSLGYLTSEEFAASAAAAGVSPTSFAPITRVGPELSL